MLEVVTELIPDDQCASFESVLTGVLIDTLTDVVNDAGNTFDEIKKLGSPDPARQEAILSQTTTAMIEAILTGLSLK